MDDFIVKETLETPSIEFYSSMGYLSIKGKSIPNDPIKFYEPLFNILDKYNDSPLAHTKVDFRLEYFNTSSSKCILNILRKIQSISLKSKRLSVNWFYDEDDEEILEAGEDFSKIIGIPFNLKSNSIK